MKQRRLFWKIYPYIFVIIISSLILTTIYASREMRNIHLNQISKTLENRARLLEPQFEKLIDGGDIISIDSLCKEYGKLSGTRITVINTEGIVLGDSDKDPQLMENHGSRPEIVQAYDNETGTSIRFSNSLQTNMKYIAIPITDKGSITGVIRTSLPTSDIKETLYRFYLDVTIGGLVIVLLAGFVSFIVFKRFTNPLGELQKGAEEFASGKLDYKLQSSNTEEIASLAESMNRMAEELNSRIETIVDQRNEREAILTSMTEGIVALDARQKVVTLNKAASLFFDLNPSDVLKKSIYEVFRITDLHRLVDETSTASTTIEKEIKLLGENNKYLQAHGTVLTDASENRIGMVLVFNDITRLKKLENIRRDFVANVSHELKTPITTILGSAETLLNATSIKPEDNKRFLDMIVRNSENLNNLVDDLLALSHLESEKDEGEIELSRCKLIDVLASSITLFETQSKSSDIQLKCECEPSLEVDINFRHLEQAVNNLIDNALKFSKQGDSVSITAIKADDEIIIAVEDHGCGIESKHLPRLFERFYRVDKARGREIGGTGLGLAIVKHIALSHGGRVSVDSIPGKGSIFRIHLPG